MTENASPVPVPVRLTRPHPFIATLREALRHAPRDEQNRLHPPPRAGLVRCAVSRDLANRTLRILQAIFVEAERRGYAVTDSIDLWNAFRGVAISVRGHAYPIAISELCNRDALTDEERAQWRQVNQSRLSYTREPTHRYIPNGRLRLSFPNYMSGRRSNWAEGPRGSLEQKLTDVFDELESWADEDDLRDAERKHKEEERQQLYEARLEQERLDRIQEARVERLTAQVASWRLAADVRSYVAQLQDRLACLPDDELVEVREWADWATAWAEESDPLVDLALIALRNETSS